MIDTVKGYFDPADYVTVHKNYLARLEARANNLALKSLDHVSVPREPTQEMVKAFEDEGGKFSYMAWSAMIDRATAPHVSDEVNRD